MSEWRVVTGEVHDVRVLYMYYTGIHLHVCKYIYNVHLHTLYMTYKHYKFKTKKKKGKKETITHTVQVHAYSFINSPLQKLSVYLVTGVHGDGDRGERPRPHSGSVSLKDQDPVIEEVHDHIQSCSLCCSIATPLCDSIPLLFLPSLPPSTSICLSLPPSASQ